MRKSRFDELIHEYLYYRTSFFETYKIEAWVALINLHKPLEITEAHEDLLCDIVQDPQRGLDDLILLCESMQRV